MTTDVDRSSPDFPSRAAARIYDPPGEALGTYRVLESVDDEMFDRHRTVLGSRVRGCLALFPELNGSTVTVARADPDDGRYYAKADVWNDLIFVPVDHVVPRMTVVHELAHLAIHRLDDRFDDVPHTSEEFCSILAVARIPVDWIDTDEIAYLGEPGIPKPDWPTVCRDALDYRTRRRNYIQQAKEWLRV